MINNNYDPITTEILRNAFISIAEDMNATLIRSAYSALIYESTDCSVALLDENGNVLGQSSGLPIFLGNLEVCVKLTAEMFGWDVFKPGDVFIMNDSYMTGTHLGDVTIYGPIFFEKQLVGFSATRAHWSDVGAKDPVGSNDSTEIYQEGIRWGPTKVYDNGIPREDIIDLIRRNSRFGYQVVGDLNAQIAACKTGQERFCSLINTYGYDVIKNARDAIYKQSETVEREAVKNIPDGSYSSEGYVDSDGQGNGPICVKVKVNVSGDTMNINLDGSSPQVPGSVNCGFAQAISACRVAFKLMIRPDSPVTGGSFKNLSVEAPEGSIFRAEEPAACQWYFTPLGLLIDLIIKALSPVVPDRVAAAHFGDSMVLTNYGVDTREGKDKRRFVSVEALPGGWGGYVNGDGQDALINIVNAGYKDMPVEVFENKYPIRINEYSLRIDSGGIGEFRGGCGIIREEEMLSSSYISTWFDRSVTTAWGLFGGSSGKGPSIVFNPGRSSEERFLKVNYKKLVKGDVIRVKTGGGGGFGSPVDRDPNLVLSDVIDGFISQESAYNDYGVVLLDDLSIDYVRTNARRSELRKYL